MIRLKVNGREYVADASPDEVLADVLRDKLGFLGVKVSCGRGECGACTILLDGKPATSCLMLAAQAEGKEITTIEGLAKGEELHPIQQAFLDEHGMQCGFCTPGIILTTKALLDENPAPSEQEVAQALNGHICRCGGYPRIVKSVMKAAEAMRGAGRQ